MSKNKSLTIVLREIEDLLKQASFRVSAVRRAMAAEAKQANRERMKATWNAKNGKSTQLELFDRNRS